MGPLLAEGHHLHMASRWGRAIIGEGSRSDQHPAVIDPAEPHRLTTRAPIPSSGDELQRLSETVNALLAGMAEGHRRQVRFTSDAAHELRTPLMALAGELDLATMAAAVAPERRPPRA
jgi:signal transduction histidine kinase